MFSETKFSQISDSLDITYISIFFFRVSSYRGKYQPSPCSISACTCFKIRKEEETYSLKWRVLKQFTKMVSNYHITLILFKAFQLILLVQVHLKIIFSYVQRKKKKHMKTQCLDKRWSTFMKNILLKNKEKKVEALVVIGKWRS